MLSLSPPFLDVDGMIIARDYADPTQFWYYPNRPHLAVDDGRPAVRFLVFREDLDDIPGDEDEAAGFLFFDTSLEWDTATRTKAERQIEDRFDDLDGREFRLSPLLYRSGSVRLMFLDRATANPGDPPPDDDEPGDWVSVIESSGTPSLYGENRAVFSVMLTKKAARLLYGSFDGLLPAGVVYDLTYAGMQRAFRIEIDAKWEQVYAFLRTYTEDRFLFWSDEATSIVEKLEESRAVRFVSTIEGIGEEGMPGEYADARKLLGQFLFEKFFAPLPNPRDAGSNVGDDVLGFLGALRQGGLPFAWTGRSEQLDVTRDLSLEVDWTVNKAVERRIAPQATLSLLWSDFPDLRREDVVTVVTGDDDLWRTAELGFVANADFGAQGIARIVVHVAYGPMDGPPDGPTPAAGTRTFSRELTAQQPRAAVREWYDPALGTGFHYRYEVAFSPGAVVGDGVTLDSGWRPATGTSVTISPAELYDRHETTFQRSALLDPAVFPEVLAHLRYADPGTGWQHGDSELLAATGSAAWTPVFRSRHGAPRELEYRLDYRRAGGPITTPWTPTAETTVLLDDPRPNLFRVGVLVAVPRETFAQALVEFRYTDPEHGIAESGRLVITADTVAGEHAWTFFRGDPARTRYWWSAVLVTTDGAIVETGWVQSDRPTLVLSEQQARRWPVQVELAGPPLASAGVERVTVDLVHAGATRREVFTAPGLSEPWLLELADLGQRSLRWTARYRLRNGFEKVRGPATSDATFLVVPSGPPP